jgi:NAD(P)-dependent dehydrogenase (short-subunit alcohol dehydrogenase family)
MATAMVLAELGGAVTVLDVKDPSVPVGKFIRADLRDRSAIDTALGDVEGPIDALFGCAGVADGAPGLPQVNFIGQRHLIESALERDMVPPGSAIVMIASIGGIGWESNLATLGEFLDTPDFDTASKWIDAHPNLANYKFSKQAVIAYCARRAPALLRRGVRINCTAPGPTITPLLQAHEGWIRYERSFSETMGKPGTAPEEQAYPLVFLGSDAASYVSGTVLVVDTGFVGGGKTGAVESALFRALLEPAG